MVKIRRTASRLEVWRFGGVRKSLERRKSEIRGQVKPVAVAVWKLKSLYALMLGKPCF